MAGDDDFHWERKILPQSKEVYTYSDIYKGPKIQKSLQ